MLCHLIPCVLKWTGRRRLLWIGRLLLLGTKWWGCGVLWTVRTDIWCFISCMIHLIINRSRSLRYWLFAWWWKIHSQKRWPFFFDQYLLLCFRTHQKLLLWAENDLLRLLLDCFAAHTSKYIFNFLAAAQSYEELWEILHFFDSLDRPGPSFDSVDKLIVNCLCS